MSSRNYISNEDKNIYVNSEYEKNNAQSESMSGPASKKTRGVAIIIKQKEVIMLIFFVSQKNYRVIA